MTTVLVSVFAMHFVVMEVALPLWVAGHTEAPRWIVAVVFGVNTVAVALLQVRFSRTVSYTHPDVYKRQAPLRPAGVCRPPASFVRG